jgi:P-type Ca2+ transporter type 2C
MSVDPQTEDVMAGPPRRPEERAIDAPMLWGVVWTGLTMALATLATLTCTLPAMPS